MGSGSCTAVAGGCVQMQGGPSGTPAAAESPRKGGGAGAHQRPAEWTSWTDGGGVEAGSGVSWRGGSGAACRLTLSLFHSTAQEGWHAHTRQAKQLVRMLQSELCEAGRGLDSPASVYCHYFLNQKSGLLSMLSHLFYRTGSTRPGCSPALSTWVLSSYLNLQKNPLAPNIQGTLENRHRRGFQEDDTNSEQLSGGE